MPGDPCATHENHSSHNTIQPVAARSAVDNLGIIPSDASPHTLANLLIGIAKREDQIISQMAAAVRCHDVQTVFSLATELTNNVTPQRDLFE